MFVQIPDFYVKVDSDDGFLFKFYDITIYNDIPDLPQDIGNAIVENFAFYPMNDSTKCAIKSFVSNTLQDLINCKYLYKAFDNQWVYKRKLDKP